MSNTTHIPQRPPLLVTIKQVRCFRHVSRVWNVRVQQRILIKVKLLGVMSLFNYAAWLMFMAFTFSLAIKLKLSHSHKHLLLLIMYRRSLMSMSKCYARWFQIKMKCLLDEFIERKNITYSWQQNGWLHKNGSSVKLLHNVPFVISPLNALRSHTSTSQKHLINDFLISPTIGLIPCCQWKSKRDENQGDMSRVLDAHVCFFFLFLFSFLLIKSARQRYTNR